MVSPSKKGQPMVMGASGEVLANTWLEYVKSAKGLLLSTAIVALLLLIAQEFRGSGYPQASGEQVIASLGRKGAVLPIKAVSATPQQDCPVVELKDEISALYAQIRKQAQKIDELQAENSAMSAQLRHHPHSSSLTGAAFGAAPGQAAANVAVSAAGSTDDLADGGPSGTLFAGFQFFQGQDFDGEDLLHEGALEDNLPALARKCKQMPECQAFNSQGWLKNGLKPVKKWYTWSKLDNKGIFVKQEYIASMQ